MKLHDFFERLNMPAFQGIHKILPSKKVINLQVFTTF